MDTALWQKVVFVADSGMVRPDGRSIEYESFTCDICHKVAPDALNCKLCNKGDYEVHTLFGYDCTDADGKQAPTGASNGEDSAEKESKKRRVSKASLHLQKVLVVNASAKSTAMAMVIRADFMVRMSLAQLEAVAMSPNSLMPSLVATIKQRN